jgi:hypothetical protein
MSNEFQVCLPSNVPGNTKNTAGKYETTLAKPLNLGPGWEVALIDVTFPHTWINLTKKYFVLICGLYTAAEAAAINDTTADEITNLFSRNIMALMAVNSLTLPENTTLITEKLFTIPMAEYDIKSLLEFMQENVRAIKNGLENIMFRYDYDKKRISVSGQTRTFYIFTYTRDSILDLLGFGSQSSNSSEHKPETSISWLKFDTKMEKEAAGACNLKPIKSIYCYTNITEFVMVGNTQAPLLGYFPVNTKSGDTGYWNFNPPYYLPVKDSGIRSIDMQLCSDTGETLQFKSGDVICRLHFRRTGTLRSII